MQKINETVYPVEMKWVYKPVVTFVIFLLITFGLFLVNYVNYYLLLALLYLPFYIIVVYLRRQNFHYSLEDKFLFINQGVVNKQQRNIPYGVIQNVLVKQDLFDRVFGLASLSLENASQGAGAKGFFSFSMRSNRKESDEIGSIGNKVVIPGLTKANAESLKPIILDFMKRNPVETIKSGL